MARLFWMTSGLVFWAAQFTIIYGLTGVACARGWYRLSIFGLDLVRAGIVAATLLALAASAFVFWTTCVAMRAKPAEPSTERFIGTTTLWICGLSFVAIAFNGLPAMILPPCSV